jgi:uncharacterized protein YtpQ (UPF0354 family)
VLQRLLEFDGPTGAHVARRAFARGVASALSVPRNVDGETLEFPEAVATVLPVIEHDAFAIGLEAAGSGPAYRHPLASGLRVYFEVELDDGVHVLTQRQVERWGCTTDRIFKAALSILFHRSWTCSLERAEDGPLLAANGGDGRDAARLLIADLWSPEHTGEAAWVAIPSLDDLYLVRVSEDPEGTRIAEAAREAFLNAEAPLSEDIFRLERGRISTR